MKNHSYFRQMLGKKEYYLLHNIIPQACNQEIKMQSQTIQNKGGNVYVRF